MDVPRAGESVYYFPQGHMEQVCFFLWVVFFSFSFLPFSGFLLLSRFEAAVGAAFLIALAHQAFWPSGVLQLQASTNQELNQELSQQIPHFNLPSKILCRVVHIQLLVLTFDSFCFLSLFVSLA